MIKFTLRQRDGRVLLGLGLSRANAERLLAGQPIPVETTDLGIGWDGTILLLGGQTEAAMARELRALGLIDAHTEVRGDQEVVA